MAQLLRQRLVRFLAALVVLVALAAGVPWLLGLAGRTILGTANPIPARASISGMRDWASHQLGSSELITVLTRALLTVGWVAWAVLIVKIVTAIGRAVTAPTGTTPRRPGTVTHRRARSTASLTLRSTGAFDGLAHWIAAALTALTVTVPTIRANASTGRPPATVTAPATTGTTTPRSGTPTSNATVASTPVAVGERALPPSWIRVQTGDTAETIAGRHLGDPTRWRDLFSHNEGNIVDTVTGATWTQPWRILPGWILQLPDTTPVSSAPDPVSLTPDPAPADTDATSDPVVVAAGDTLWSIIEQHKPGPVTITDIAAVADANDGTTDQAGHRFNRTNPSLINPGQVFDLTVITPPTPGTPPPPSDVAPEQLPPPTPGTAPTPAPTTAPTTTPPPTPTAPVTPAATLPVPPAPAPSATVPASVSTVAASAEHTLNAHRTGPTAPPPPVSSPGVDDVGWVALAGITGSTVLASGLWLAIGRLRRRRAALDARLGLLPPSSGDSELETAVFRAADVLFTTWAGQVLARLYGSLPAGFAAHPAVIELVDPTPEHTTTTTATATELVGDDDAGGVEVVWDRPVTKTPPPGWSSTHEGHAWRHRYDPDATFDRLWPPPLPSLVTIGRRDPRHLVLFDLATVGSITVTAADVSHARDVVRAMALSWCADCDLSLVTVSPIGIDIDAAAQLNRFEPLSAVAALNLARADREPFDVPFGTNRGDVIADEFRVFIIDATHPAATELVALCQPTLAFAVIAIGDMPGVGARLQLTGTGRAHLEPLGLDVDTTPVTRETAAALSVLLDPETPLVPEPVLAHLFGELLDQADTIAEGHLFNPGPPHPPPADDPPVSVVTAPAVEGAVLATRHEHAHDHDTAAGVDDDGAGDGGAGLVDEHGVAIVGFDDTDDSDRRLDAGPLTLLPQWQHRLRVLGPVRVDGIDSLSGPARSIVAYLAMARFEQTDTERRVRPDILADRVWGGRLRSKDTLSNAITAIRRALPLDSDQPAILRRGRGDDAVDSLNPAIGTDLEQLAAAISVAPTLSSSDAIEVLTHVLALVEGFPFQGRYLDWAEEAHSMWAYKAVAFVEEAAVQLITLAIDTRDPHLVETALAAGGRGCPNSERLLKARMMYAMSQGSLTGFVTAWKTALADHDAELSPDLTTWVDTQRARLTHK